MFVRLERRRRAAAPWACVLIAAICAIVFLWLLHMPGAARDEFVRAWGTVPAQLFDANASATNRPAWQPLAELRWLRVASALFIHAGWLHLLGNVLFLLIFGLPAERALGAARFLALFLLGGALANLIEALTLPETTAPIVGASGAVSAVIGAYVFLFPRAHLGLVLPLGVFLEFVRVPALLLIGFWALLQYAFASTGPNFGSVAWWTHIIGFVLGILFAALARPAIRRRLRD